ncbi:regulator of protease activity HflC (stomatin/prohibitin superfamily) [Catenulispora sp. EB89]|uniref:slipin family protein n=1 Tax=Catenulispora sp. EB89 TaxID=3156257 RepID=UPI003518E68B
MITAIVSAIIAAAAAGAAGFGASLRTVKQYERGIVFRFGRALDSVRQPGLTRIIPGVDRLRTVNMQVVTMPVPAQEGITRDNVTVRVDAVVYFRVVDPARALIYVQDYKYAVSLVAQTSLRSIIGKSLLDDLLSNREPLNQGMELMLETPATGWGVEIDRVEIKDVALPESMKRSMARQAEADRERRARIITADGEYQASGKLADAARIMAETPAALQLRLLQTIVEVAAEKNSTLVLPFPVELLRFLESAGGGAATTDVVKAAYKAVDTVTKSQPDKVDAGPEHIAIEGGESDDVAIPPPDEIPDVELAFDEEPPADAIARPLTEPLIETPHWRDISDSPEPSSSESSEPSEPANSSKPSDS